VSWVQNPDGSITATVTCHFPAATYDPLGTGTATMTIVLDNATATVAALASGPAGPPPEIRNIIVNQLTPGVDTMPTPAASATLITPGDSGTPSVYDLTLNIWKGTDGDDGTPGSILGSSDITGTPADGQVIVYSSATSKGVWKNVATLPVVRPLFVVAGSSFTALTMSTSTTTGIMTSLTIPGQPFAYRPRVEGEFEVTGAVGTRIDGEIRMGSSATDAATIATSGTRVGAGRGVESAGAVLVPVRPRIGAAVTPGMSSPPAVVAASTDQKFVFSAVRQYGTSAWSTTQTDAELRIWLEAV
jgi:hypothetical protein